MCVLADACFDFILYKHSISQLNLHPTPKPPASPVASPEGVASHQIQAVFHMTFLVSAKEEFKKHANKIECCYLISSTWIRGSSERIKVV